MWKWKKSESQDAGKKDNPHSARNLAALGASKAEDFVIDHLQSLENTKKDQEGVLEVIRITEERMQEFARKIDLADQELAVTKKTVEEGFDSLSATFTALCEKVKKGNLPTTALATNDAQALAALQGMNTNKAAAALVTPAAQPKPPGT